MFAVHQLKMGECNPDLNLVTVVKISIFAKRCDGEPIGVDEEAMCCKSDL